MNTITKILYIGTGLHVEPVIDFSEVKDFIFIDTQPRSEFDDCHVFFDKRMYKKNFILNLIKKFKILNFELVETIVLDKKFKKTYLSIIQKIYYKPSNINPTILYFVNKKTNQTVKYYVSTNIKINYHKLLDFDLSSSDTLLISGHFPDDKLLNYIDKPKKLVCYSGTVYKCDIQEIDEKTILPYLKDTKYFSKCFFVNKKKNYKITEYENYNEMFKHNFIILD